MGTVGLGPWGDRGEGDRAGRFHFPLSMNNPSGPILWGTAPVPKWQSLVRLCLRMRNYRYPDFPSKRSFWMENPPRPQPHNAPSGRKETVGRGKRTGKRTVPCLKGMVEDGSRIFHPKLAFGWKIYPALSPPLGSFTISFPGVPRATSSGQFPTAWLSTPLSHFGQPGLDFETPHTLWRPRAGF